MRREDSFDPRHREGHRPVGPVIRSEMQIIEMPPFNRVSNRIEVIFDGAIPQHL